MQARFLSVALVAFVLVPQAAAQGRANPLHPGGPGQSAPTSTFQALGSVTGFTDRGAWLAAAGGSSVLVDFDSLADGTLVTGTGALLPWGVANTFGSSVHAGVLDQFVYCSCTLPFPMFVAGTLPSEPNYFANNRTPPAYATGRITIEFANPTRACGAFVADQSPLAGFTIELFDAGGASLGAASVTHGALPNSFVGIVSPVPFAAAEFRADHPNDSWGLDNLEHISGTVGTVYCASSSCPCGNWGSAGEGCANSTGSGVILSPSGSTSVSANDLVLTGGQMIPGQPVLLFSGLNAVNGGLGQHFGDGQRCAGGSVQRLGVRIPDAQGAAVWGPGLAGAGGWLAGDTRRLQSWYRDPAGPCGSGFNLSHGLELVFEP